MNLINGRTRTGGSRFLFFFLSLSISLVGRHFIVNEDHIWLGDSAAMYEKFTDSTKKELPLTNVDCNNNLLTRH